MISAEAILPTAALTSMCAAALVISEYFTKRDRKRNGARVRCETLIAYLTSCSTKAESSLKEPEENKN